MKIRKKPLTAPYTATEVCRVTHVSYRQLDYWARTGLVVPSLRLASGSGEGKHRLYSEGDLDRLRLILRLLGLGVSLQAIRQDGDPCKTQLRLIAELSEIAATEVPAEERVS